MTKQLTELKKCRAFSIFVPKLNKKTRTITVALPCVEEALVPAHVSGTRERKYYVDPTLEKQLLAAGFKKITTSCGSNGYKIHYMLRY